MRSSRELNGVASKVGVLLLRRSTNMQDKSIAEQREYLKDWARQHGYSVVDEYIDDAVSGDAHSRRRGFDRLMQDLERPGRAWGAILAYDRSRYTRADIFEAAGYADRILKAGADVLFCSEGKSLSTDHDVVWAVETFQKNEVLKQTSRDTLRGMLGLARKGFWCGGPFPYGYDGEIIDKLSGKPLKRIRLMRRMKTLEDGTRQPAIHHVLDLEGNLVREVESGVESTLPLKSDAELTKLVPGCPERIRTIRRIFEMMAGGTKGYKAICQELNGRSIAPPSGNGLWRVSAVKAILDNPVYRGTLEWNSRTEAKYNYIQNGTMVAKPRHAKSGVFVHEESDRIQVHAPALALVTPEVWHRAQAVRAERADSRFKEENRVTAHTPLGGKLICGQCGAKMYRRVTKRKKKVRGRLHTYESRNYLCSTYSASGVNQCGNNRVPQGPLEQFILDAIRKLMAPILGTAGFGKRVETRLQDMFGAGPRPQNASALKKQLKEFEQKVAVLDRMSSIDRATIGKEAEYHRLKGEISRISRDLEELKSRPRRKDSFDFGMAAKEIITCLSDLAGFERLPVETQKSFFNRFVESVTFSFKKVKKGKRWGSMACRGVLRLYEPQNAPSLRLKYSGGPLSPLY